MNTLSQLLSEASESPVHFQFGCQLQKCTQRLTKSQKPYYELELVDAGGSGALKIWNNHPQFDQTAELKVGAFLLGDPLLKAKQDEDWDTITELCAEIKDPRLHALCQQFFGDFTERFRRAAAARKNHHARRGGLTEHVAQMMRSAAAICSAYPSLNQDLIITAILFHDCGKLWENNYPETDFHQTYNLHAEALGHITLGIELVNKLWRDICEIRQSEWKLIEPATEQVRIHLLHMIASHHGQLDFGSPVVPKTPEAFALHYIDNLDAKMEMCELAYANSNSLSSHIVEKKFPLPGNLILPLKKYK